MAEIIQAIEEDIMKTFQISDKIKAVSRIGIGCMRITDLPDEKAIRELIDGAMELGINFFDHADIYAAGEAEAVFGNVLTPTLREHMVIQTSGPESVMIFQKNIF